MKRVFSFRHYDEVPEGGSESKKWREAKLLPRENQHTNMTSLVRHSLTHETRSSFSALWWSARRRLWIEKMKRSKTCLLPRENQHTNMTSSRTAPAHARSVFLRFWRYEEVPEGGLRSKKWREANLFVIPKKRSWDLRQCKLTLFTKLISIKILVNYFFFFFLSYQNWGKIPLHSKSPSQVKHWKTSNE